MKTLIAPMILVLLGMTAANASPLVARTNTLVASTERPGIRSDEWGELSIADNAITRTGAKANNVPYIEFRNKSADTGIGEYYTSTSLTYEWMISGPDNMPVLTHINTVGRLQFDYGILPDDPSYNLYANMPAGIITTRLTTNTASGPDGRVYGLQAGNYNYSDVVRLDQPGSTVTNGAHGFFMNGEFNISFDLWVVPNTVNSVSMQAESALYKFSAYPSEYGTEFYDFYGYIDPLIQIDAAFADRYMLDVAAVPLDAAVPEPSSLGLFLGAGGMLALGRIRIVARRSAGTAEREGPENASANQA